MPTIDESKSLDDLNQYDYELPRELIADKPLQQRDESRLLVVNRKTQRIDHCRFRDFPALLNAGDCLVLNDTRVLPARLLGRRTATGGHWEGLYLDSPEPGIWRLIGQTRGKLRGGEQISLFPVHAPDSGEELRLTLIDREEDGVWRVKPESDRDVLDLLQRFGSVPLPPYLQRELADQTDWDRYQTTYAQTPGAVAAPTAGLHFTPEVLSECDERRIRQAYVTLHVGLGTFRPVSVQKLSEHRMHSEWCQLPESTVEAIRSTRQAGGRVIAVGTTTVRTLETVAQQGDLRPWQGETDLFIRPPFRFRAIDGLLTNFHLPRSTLLVLVSTFGGFELIRRAYREAVREKYRFYSYGDAMLIL